MTQQHPSSPLRDRILAALPDPLTERGAEALQSFLELPFVDDWHPQNMYLGELSSVFDVGLPFSFLRGNASAEARRRECGNAISRGERTTAGFWSEVHAGALLSNWGANVTFAPRQAKPTPDIEANWGDAVILDVEVVRGKTRQLHMAVQRGVEAFVGALQPGDVAWNVVGFIADASRSEDVEAMFEAATNLQPEESAGDADRWYVRAVPLDRRDEVVGAQSVEIFGPNCWPSGEPIFRHWHLDRSERQPRGAASQFGSARVIHESYSS